MPLFDFLIPRTPHRIPFFSMLISIFYYLCFMPGRKQHIIRLIRQKINEIDNSAEVILYGSRARGDNKPDSDWDIMILLNQKNVDKKTEQSFRHHLLDLELEIGVPISVFVYSKIDWEGKYSVTPLARSIKKEGIVIQ